MGCTSAKQLDNTTTPKELVPNIENLEKQEKPAFLKGIVTSARNLRSGSNSSDNSDKPNIKPNILNLTAALNNTELFDSINWIEKNKSSIKEFESLKNDLTMEYKERVKTQLQTYFSNINVPIETAKDETLFTTKPENTFYILNIFVNVVKTKLSKEHAKEIMVIGLQLLRDTQRLTYDYLERNWATIQEDALCALMNDNARIKQLCDQVNLAYTHILSDEITNIIFDAVISELLHEYDLIILKITDCLINKILNDFEIDYFSKLFCTEWENSDNLTLMFVNTLKRCFDAILKWMCESNANVFINNIFKQVLLKYISSLKNKKNKSVVNLTNVINQINADKQLFKIFFSSYCDSSDFDFLDTICKMMLSRNFDSSKKEVDLLCVKFGADGLKFAKHAYNYNPANAKKLGL